VCAIAGQIWSAKKPCAPGVNTHLRAGGSMAAS
jgi:hypothetical protein